MSLSRAVYPKVDPRKGPDPVVGVDRLTDGFSGEGPDTCRWNPVSPGDEGECWGSAGRPWFDLACDEALLLYG